MCVDPGTAAMVVSAGAKLAQGISDYQTGNANAKLARMEGQSAMDAANAQAGQIGNQGQRAIGQIEAQQAASGVDISSGSAADVTAESAKNVELDRLMALSGGQLKMWAKNLEASQLKAQARGALFQSVLGLGGSLLGDAAKAGTFGGPALNKVQGDYTGYAKSGVSTPDMGLGKTGYGSY